MWDLPGSGVEPVSPALAGRLFTTEPFDMDGFENTMAEKQLISDGCGVKDQHIPHRGPWTNGGPCTQSLGTVPSLLMPANNSYRTVQKRLRGYFVIT